MAKRQHKDIFASDIAWTLSENGVHYAPFPLDPDDAAGSPLVLLAKFKPGESIYPHTHGCNYLEYIVEGSQRVGKVSFSAGDVRWASAGTGYGPIEVGPDGCTVMIVFQSADQAPMIPLGMARRDHGGNAATGQAQS
jgi:anti-sigma factor ChrR (cupin superfamily)